MATIARGTKAGGGTNFNAGQVIAAAELNTDFNTAYTEINGLLDDGNIKTATIPGAKSLRFTEIAAPSSPAANDLLLYAKDDGAGTTRLYTKDSAGTEQLVGGGLSATASGDAESTTATGSAADIKAITVAATTGQGLLILCNYRKSSGAASAPTLGLKVNSTQVIPNTACCSSTNQAEQGFAMFWLWQQTTSYLRGGFAQYLNDTGSINTTVGMTANMPNAAITSVTITGSSVSASITLGVADAACYLLG